MPQSTTATELSKLIKELRSEREQHVDAIARIDSTFSQFGILPEGGSTVNKSKSVSPKKATKKTTKKSKKTKRKRGGPSSYAVTGEESILDFVSKNKEANSKQINEHWDSEGRGGRANNTLTKLVNDGKLKRVQKRNERGGRYRVSR